MNYFTGNLFFSFQSLSMIFFSHYNDVTSVSIYNFPGIPLMSKVSDKIHMGSQASISFSIFSVIDSEALGLPELPYIISHNCCRSPAASFITQTGGLRWVGVQGSPRGILNCVCLELQIDACHHCLSNTFRKNNKSSSSLVYFPIHPAITTGEESSWWSGKITNSESTELDWMRLYHLLHAWLQTRHLTFLSLSKMGLILEVPSEPGLFWRLKR